MKAKTQSQQKNNQSQVLSFNSLRDKYFKKVFKRKRKGLTTREIEIIKLVLEGKINKDIADDLYVKEKTIKFHLSNVFKKLNLTGRIDLILYATDQILRKINPEEDFETEETLDVQ